MEGGGVANLGTAHHLFLVSILALLWLLILKSINKSKSFLGGSLMISIYFWEKQLFFQPNEPSEDVFKHCFLGGILMISIYFWEKQLFFHPNEPSEDVFN